MIENPRRGRQERNFTTNVPKILVLKSSSKQIFSRWVPLHVQFYVSLFFACDRSKNLLSGIFKTHGVVVKPQEASY